MQLPEGSRALEEMKIKSQRAIPGKTEAPGLGFMASALKSLSDGFALDPFAQQPGSSGTNMTTIKQKKLKVKYGTWVYPKLEKDEADFRKEANYLLDNILRDRSPLRVGLPRSEAVETYLDGVFCPNFSHLDDNIIVVPLQENPSVAATNLANQSSGTLQQSQLLAAINPEGTTYSIVYSKPDFTVLDNDVYTTEVFFCVKTNYPFVSFFCKLINVLLSKIIISLDEAKLRRLEMRAQINPPRVTEIKEGSEELRKAMIEWKKLDSSVLLGVLDGLKSTLLEPLRSMSFEAGVKYVTGMNNLTFNPVLEKASYYQPVEGKSHIHRSSFHVSPPG